MPLVKIQIPSKTIYRRGNICINIVLCIFYCTVNVIINTPLSSTVKYVSIFHIRRTAFIVIFKIVLSTSIVIIQSVTSRTNYSTTSSSAWEFFPTITWFDSYPSSCCIFSVFVFQHSFDKVSGFFKIYQGSIKIFLVDSFSLREGFIKLISSCFCCLDFTFFSSLFLKSFIDKF